MYTHGEIRLGETASFGKWPKHSANLEQSTSEQQTFPLQRDKQKPSSNGVANKPTLRLSLGPSEYLWFEINDGLQNSRGRQMAAKSGG